MGLEIYYAAVIILVCFAVFDLIVGVSNDAVNFLNSSIGSRVAPRYVIMIIASLGIMAGVIFSSGMMEVARKGIFHPQFFTMPELITIFLAVMITDIILLDLFNTYGLPTSTTVSIVFELLGAAVAVSMLKIFQQEGNLAALADYINTSKAMIIIFGILLSVVISFICGVLIQFLSRLLFSFDYAKQLKRFGAIWGGIALAFITYFILIKGIKGASFISEDTAEWINANAFTILFSICITSAVILQILMFFKINILKPIVLIGTFALAMAFAANDLVNFIGVPMAGIHAYKAALATESPLSVTMGALSQTVPTETYMLIIAGLIMVITLWFSKKARTVTETEIRLGQQEEGQEIFESSFLSRVIVRMVINFFHMIQIIIPESVRKWMAQRLDSSKYKATDSENRPSFDLLRASVNLMVASAVISYATSQKLPLSTTYVTFMVAMGTSFADLAWGRESAVYRITGVLTVISGWFLTALLAFTICGTIAFIIFHTQSIGIILLLVFTAFIIWNNHRKHSERAKISEKEKVFNLKKVKDVNETISITFEHMSYLIREIRESLDVTLDALFNQNVSVLVAERKKVTKTQKWANIIMANVFKALRLLQRGEVALSYKYAQTIRRLQKLADGHRDIVMRSYQHVSNHHKGLLDVQINELKKVKEFLNDILMEVEVTLSKKEISSCPAIMEKYKQLRAFAEELNHNQIVRVRDGSSKTRLTILYYAVVGNAIMLTKQNLKIIEIFCESFHGVKPETEIDLK